MYTRGKSAPGLSFQAMLVGIVMLPIFSLSHFSVSQAQQLDDVPDPIIWLPIRHSQQLRDELDAIIAHASTRAACSVVLEAKLADSSSQNNPKFIITCGSEQAETANLVYWSRDVANDFTEVTYPARSEAEDEDSAAADDSGISEHQRSTLIDDCKTALTQALDGANPAIDQNQIQVRKRFGERFAIFMDYQNGESKFAMKFTATCLSSPGSPIKLSIFNR